MRSRYNLTQKVNVERNNLPKTTIKNIVFSWPTRMQSILARNKDITKY